jgi:hypothetical protein
MAKTNLEKTDQEIQTKTEEPKNMFGSSKELSGEETPVSDPVSNVEKECELVDVKPDYSSKSKTKSTFKDYLRVFTYTTWAERCFGGAAFFEQIAVGTTLPLMTSM